jgi:putative MFS transporter
MRRAMPESPRWLELIGRYEKAEAMLQQNEREVALQHDSLSRPAVARPPNAGRTFSALFGPQLFSRLVVGATTLIVANTLIYGFVT